MKTRKYFTLVELLVVAGIIALLAGLILPAVIGGAQQGRITQAKSDMNSIQMALSQMDQTYQRILKKDGSKVKFLSIETTPVTSESDGDLGTTTFAIVGTKDNEHKATSKALGNSEQNGYDALIAELTTTGGSGSYSQNTRKIKFLEPNKNFNPSKAYTDDANLPLMWRDPWGNRYTVMVNLDGTDRLIDPNKLESSGPEKYKYIMGKTAVYSMGPNGVDDQGRNAAAGGGKLDDDIATWHK